MRARVICCYLSDVRTGRSCAAHCTDPCGIWGELPRRPAQPSIFSRRELKREVGHMRAIPHFSDAKVHAFYRNAGSRPIFSTLMPCACPIRLDAGLSIINIIDEPVDISAAGRR